MNKWIKEGKRKMKKIRNKKRRKKGRRGNKRWKMMSPEVEEIIQWIDREVTKHGLIYREIDSTSISTSTTATTTTTTTTTTKVITPMIIHSQTQLLQEK